MSGSRHGVTAIRCISGNLGANLAGGLLVLLSGTSVGGCEIAGQRFRGRLVFLSEHLVQLG
jgi:hypothetical protein